MKKLLLLQYIITNSSILINKNHINTCPTYDYIGNLLDTKNIYFDTKDKFINYDNVLQLGYISKNVYYSPDNTEWYDIGLNKTINITESENTIHAYLFSNYDNSVNIISFKGTSIYWSKNNNLQEIKDDTVLNDKINDNLYFACCYYKQSRLFSRYDCKCTDNPQENNCPELPKNGCYKECYKNSINYQNNYINIASNIMSKVNEIINLQDSLVILTGHSLGGTIATIMGIKYNKTVVTFEAPGEKHYLDLLGLDYMYNMDNIYHFGHNADIIFTGKCNGALSWCYLGGYNMYTKCHIGKVCEYDTINKLGMKESIFTHRIDYVINNVVQMWNNTLPECKKVDNCTDCEEWVYL